MDYVAGCFGCSMLGMIMFLRLVSRGTGRIWFTGSVGFLYKRHPAFRTFARLCIRHFRVHRARIYAFGLPDRYGNNQEFKQKKEQYPHNESKKQKSKYSYYSMVDFTSPQVSMLLP